MPLYYYKAATKSGRIVKNRVEDMSRLSLLKKLKRNGLIPIAVMQTAKRKNTARRPKKNSSGMTEIVKNANINARLENRQAKLTLKEKVYGKLALTEKVTMRDIIIFTQNFYLLKKANFNNIHALSTVIENTDNLTLKEILEDVLAGVEAGESIYATLEYYEGIFPTIYISMIKSGELSGSLTETLYQAIEYLEDAEALNKKLRGILIPNIVQFVGILVLLVVGTLFAIPMIQGVYESVGSTKQLPAISLWFQGVLETIIHYWYIPVVLIATIIGVIIFYINTEHGKYQFHYFKYKMPIFGKLIYAIDFSRFMQAVLLNVKSGIRIQDALEISKNVVHNLVLLSIIETSANNILMGKSWIEPFEKSGLSSSMITEMLRIGMQTDLTLMLEKLLDYMKIDIDALMSKIMKVLPELVYSIVGVFLIFFVVVVLVPIIQVYMGDFLFSAGGF